MLPPAIAPARAAAARRRRPLVQGEPALGWTDRGRQAAVGMADATSDNT